MDLKEIGINTRKCVDSAQDRNNWTALVNAILKLRIPLAKEVVSKLVNIILLLLYLKLKWFCIKF